MVTTVASDIDKLKQLSYDIENELEHIYSSTSINTDVVKQKFQDFKELVNKLDTKYEHGYYSSFAKSVAFKKVSEREVFISFFHKVDSSPEFEIQSINNLYGTLNMTEKKADKQVIQNKIAAKFVEKAENEKKKHHFRSINYWINAMQNFSQSLGLTNLYFTHVNKFLKTLNYLMPFQSFKSSYKISADLTSIIGYARCLIELSKYSRAIEFLDDCKSECNATKVPDYWIILAISYRNIFEYDKAKKCLQNARDNDKSNGVDLPIIDTEENLIKKLEIINNTNKKRVYKKTELEYKEENYNLRKEKKKTYRILSIDGGGIRGIIPAIWACEIEKRTRKPISHLFNMLAGTSTGGIIASALSVPEKVDKTDICQQYSNHEAYYALDTYYHQYRPRYRADKILDIYLNDGKNIFGKEMNQFVPTIFYNIRDKLMAPFSSMYENKGRYKVFENHFGDIRLEHSLTDIVIPACAEENLLATYLFNRHDAKLYFNKNDTYVDALMATSAAPTYFPSYEIKGKGLFNDGGIHVNNPTGVACGEAMRYGIKKEDLFVVSFGTGTSLPMPDSMKSSRGLFFWAMNLSKIALDAQVGNTDTQLANTLENRYTRWQVWFEEPISLDDYNRPNLSLLQDYAYQYIEEHEDEINKLINFLEND